MRITSVRLRLALWNVGVLALVLAVLGAALRYTTEARLTAGVDRELARQAQRLMVGPPRRGSMGPDGPFRRGRLGPPPSPFFLPGDGEGRPGRWIQGELRQGRSRSLEPYFSPGDGGRSDRSRWGELRRGGRRRGGGPPPMEPSGLSARIFDLMGRPLRPNTAGPWDRAAFSRAVRAQQWVYSTASGAGEPVRVLSVPRLQYGQVAGVTQFALPLTGVYEELGRLTRTQLTLIPLALLAAALGGAFLTMRALRPVRHITQAASEIGASDLSQRLPVKGRDEFSELAATFNEMLGRLEEGFTQQARTLEQQRRFTADASHELRTPLTIIKANTSLALEEERSNADYRRALLAADRAVDTTTRIVQDLLLLARGDAGQLRLDPQTLRIGELLQRAAAPFRRLEGPTLSVEIADHSLGVTGDPHHLLRLFSNLLENAVRHTPLTGRITVSASEAKGSVNARVSDTGEGIPSEHLPHVCERFYRVDTARNRRQGGSGLGLSICQSIVEAHHGSLTVESTVGKGTTVSVRLPAPLFDSRDDPVSPPREPHTGSGADNPREHATR